MEGLLRRVLSRSGWLCKPRVRLKIRSGQSGASLRWAKGIFIGYSLDEETEYLASLDESSWVCDL
jgi:hypothetical protein